MGGINKALIEIGGVTIIKRTLTIIEPLFSEIIVAGWPPGDPLSGEVINVQDNYRGVGPLAGIEAALRVASSQSVFIFGGDMPWLSEGLIRAQVSEFLGKPADILAAKSDGFLEPLHSIYSKAIHPVLARYLEGGGSPAVIDFYRLVDTRFMDLPPVAETRRALTNINRHEDLKS
jgi:molybdopterin-guanine dinucleotide biosynthesis protein A